PETSEQLKRHLVKRYLRSAPRRVEDVPTPGGDAGDVLRGLRPRARAAAALRLVEGWDTDRVAGAVGASRRRVEALVPRVPGLDLALAGLADRHALVGADLRAALLEAMSDGPGSTPVDRRWRRWAWAGAAALPVALLLGYAVQDREEGATPVEARAPEGRTTDLTAAGWRLDDDGDPPGAVIGLRLRESVRIDKGRRSAVVDLPARSSSYPGVAAYAVLWCDMPPAQDDHLRVPSGTLT